MPKITYRSHFVHILYVIVFMKLEHLGKNLRGYTQRQTTPRLQTISPSYLPDEPDVYGVITITRKEALYGTRKLISIPRGWRKRTFLVKIPPGVREGTLLRLKGLGREDTDGNREDLILAIEVRE